MSVGISIKMNLLLMLPGFLLILVKGAPLASAHLQKRTHKQGGVVMP